MAYEGTHTGRPLKRLISSVGCHLIHRFFSWIIFITLSLMIIRYNYMCKQRSLASPCPLLYTTPGFFVYIENSLKGNNTIKIPSYNQGLRQRPNRRISVGRKCPKCSNYSKCSPL